MLERSRILKQEKTMDDYKITGIYSLGTGDEYKEEIINIVTRLFNENPNCFDSDVINYKIELSNKLVKKYGQEINKYYHYTLKDGNKVVGIRYRELTDDIVALVSSYFRNKVILQVVKYETNKDYFSELRSLITYDGINNEIRIINISLSEIKNGEKNIYYWSYNNQNTADNKAYIK